ncbi:MAG TPA: lipopolysaccharide biosynthesis protein [Bacteroidales bacterium]|nr:lipopolysaccharide biosynthesis protein [Bacteroidales bacterium]
MDLRQKTISGVTWSAVDSVANVGVQFLVGIILARVIPPHEFGLVGMTTIFTALSGTFIDSGFSRALIRKSNCTDSDYSTVFYYNLGMGLLFYAILFVSAGAIGSFFKEPLLKPIIRWLGLIVLIRSFTIIQTVALTRRIDFKLQAKISVLSTMLSGIIGIVMAYTGFGVWSLVVRSLTGALFLSLLLWFWNRWRPSWVFSLTSFRELFAFGSRLLISGLIDTIYNNIYYLIIGKYFTTSELGYYTRAQMFSEQPSRQITVVLERVTYPVLSQMRNDIETLKGAFKRMIISTTFISFVLLAWVAAAAGPLVITLVGEAWRPSIIYVQMLCFPGMMFPLHALNMLMLEVQGRSELFLRLEIIKKLFAIPIIVIGVIWGVKWMIVSIMVFNLLSYFLNSYWSGRLVHYPMREQLINILPSFMLAIFTGIIVYAVGIWLPWSNFVKLMVQFMSGVVIVITVSELLRFSPYFYLKEIVVSRTISFLHVLKK